MVFSSNGVRELRKNSFFKVAANPHSLTRAGDRERDLGLVVSPFMDRKKPMIAKSQISFFNYIVLPLIEAFTAFLGNEEFDLLKHLKGNYDQWLEREIEESRLRDLEPHPQLSQSEATTEMQSSVTSTENHPSAGLPGPTAPSSSDIKSLLEEPEWKPRKLKLKPIEQSDPSSRASSPQSAISKRLSELKDDL